MKKQNTRIILREAAIFQIVKGGGLVFVRCGFLPFPAGGCSSLPSNGVAISWQDFPATWTENEEKVHVGKTVGGCISRRI